VDHEQIVMGVFADPRLLAVIVRAVVPRALTHNNGSAAPIASDGPS
jgi:hypothetical protein